MIHDYALVNSNMSGLKRFKPEEQDATLKRLQEISSSRIEHDTIIDCHSSLPCSSLSFADDIDKAVRVSLNLENHKDAQDEKANMNAGKSNCIPDWKVTCEPSSNYKPNPTAASPRFSPKIKTRMKNQPEKKVQDCLPPPIFPGCIGSQPSPPPRLKVVPPHSPKIGHRFENWHELGSCSSSPSSPSRKYFKFVGSPATFSGGVRRGSEPKLDGVTGTDLNEVKMSMTDRRWEKLRSMLLTMKSEPYDVDSILGFSAATPSDDLKQNIDLDSHAELSAQRQEISSLLIKLELKDSKLNQALNERDTALAYIQKCKLHNQNFQDENKNELVPFDAHSSPDVCESNREKTEEDTNTENADAKTYKSCVYAKDLELLKAESSTKADAVKLLSRVVEELRVKKSYLNHLTSVVLERAPWMLDEVDKGDHWKDDILEDYRWTNSSDDEVWC